MELKYVLSYIFVESGEGSNRTFMELKLPFTELGVWGRRF